MAGERKHYNQTLSRWDQLHAERAYSVPDDVGTLAVMYSLYDYFKNGSEQEQFEVEAFEIVQRATAQRKKAEVIRINSGRDLDDVFGCRDYSSIVTIGHGALSLLYIQHGFWHGKEGNRYDWRDVSKAATHLKTGVFTQRQCGNASRQFSPPMGALAMASHANVHAAANRYFNPTSLDDEENLLIVPVTTTDRLSYEDVKVQFSYKEFLISVTPTQEQLDQF
jgi:hypothetical protein